MNDTNALETLSQFHAQLPTAWQTHWPAIALGAAWLVREAHIWWPFLINNGGIAGVIQILIHGKPSWPDNTTGDRAMADVRKAMNVEQISAGASSKPDVGNPSPTP